jgi:hypothetical protein
MTRTERGAHGAFPLAVQSLARIAALMEKNNPKSGLAIRISYGRIEFPKFAA